MSLPPDRRRPDRIWGAVVERRSSQRFAVDIPGQLFDPHSKFKLSCQIVDLSDGGARVVLKPPEPLPISVRLFESRHGNVFECQVRWQKNDNAGLHFIDMCASGERSKLIAALIPPSE